MKNKGKGFLQKIATVLTLSVFLSMPAFAMESTAPAEPAEPTQQEMDEAYDEAMMQADSEISFLTLEEVNYRLAVLLKFASDKLTDEDYAEMKDPDVERLLSTDGLIAQCESLLKENDMQTDLSAYEEAVSSWKEYREGLSKDTEAADDAIYEQLPLESRAEYLETAYNVGNAVWSVLKNELGELISGVTGLGSDIGTYLEEGASVVSNAFSLLDQLNVTISVGSDSARYEKRIALQIIKTKLNLLQQMLQLSCNIIETIPSF